ncbi:MAG: hypothetical protein KAS17_08290, partial [Victivallaceae bacterium]|nr:hypothetical protein [Victivallaceae bacterium]
MKTFIITASMVCFFATVANCETINPYPREIIDKQVAEEWNFEDNDTNGWGADSDCRLSFGKSLLSVEYGDNDPHFSTPEVTIKGPVLVELRARNKSPGNGQFFWSTTDLGESAGRSARVELINDGKYHNYSVKLSVDGTMKKLRFDPSVSAGNIDIDWMRLTSLTYHPLEIIEVKTFPDKIIATVTNHSDNSVPFSFENKKHIIAGEKTLQLQKVLKSK